MDIVKVGDRIRVLVLPEKLDEVSCDPVVIGHEGTVDAANILFSHNNILCHRVKFPDLKGQLDSGTGDHVNFPADSDSQMQFVPVDAVELVNKPLLKLRKRSILDMLKP